MESAAGVTVVALFVLWLGYFVPQMIQHRVALVEARVEDRHSGSLRVVAVSGRTGRRGGAMTNGTHTRDVLPSDVTETPAQRQALADQRARRAVRARRRLALTSVVLVATAAAWLCVAATLMHWAVAAGPTAVLVALLVAGRRAAVRARRAEEAVEAARRAARQRATQARALANGGPYAPRNRLRLSDTGEPAGRGPRGRGVLDEIMTVPEPTRAKVVDESGAPATEGVDEKPAPGQHEAGGGAWDPVPVPLPTYVTKPRAPRYPELPAAKSAVTPAESIRDDDVPGESASDDSAARLAAAVRASAGMTTGEVGGADRPGTEDEATVATSVAESSSTTDTQSGVTAAEALSSTTGTHPDEGELMRPSPRVRDETLAQPLEQILARRRAAG